MSRYEGRSAESNTLSLSNLLIFSFNGAKPSSSMSSISIFWVRGHLALGAPLTGMCGKIQKHFSLINLMYVFLRLETESFHTKSQFSTIIVNFQDYKLSTILLCIKCKVKFMVIHSIALDTMLPLLVH